MPVVQMPDGALMEMPDNPTPEQVSALKAKLSSGATGSYDSDVAAAKDVVKSGGSGVVQGFEGLAKLITGAIKSYGSAASGQSKALLEATNPQAAAAAEKAPAGGMQLDEGVSAVADAIGANYEPQTAGGRYAKSIGNQVPGYLTGPGGAALKTTGTLLSGVGAEAANQAMGGDSNLGRFTGGLAGALVAPTVALKAKNAKEILAQALQGLTPDDFNDARGVAKTLTDLNIPFLASQTFKTPTTLPSIVRQASENTVQGPRMLRYLEDVPDAAEAAISTRMAKLAPSGGGQQARDAAQETAEAYMKKVDQVGAQEYVKNMPQRFDYDKQTIKDLYDDLQEVAIDMGKTSNAGEFIMRKARALKDADGNWQTDSNAISQLYKELNASFPDIGKLGTVEAQRVKEVFRAATPEFDQARTAFSTFKEQVANPQRKSLTGQIATYGGGQQVDQITRNENMLKLVFPKNEAQPAQIRKLARDMRAAGNPEAFNGLAADYVSQAMQGAFKNKALQGPAKLIDNVYATNAQKVNLNTAIEEAARSQGLKPDLVRKGFERFFDAMDSYRRLDVKVGVNAGQLAEEAGKTATGAILSPRFVFRRMKENSASNATFKEIADIMMSPKGLDTLEQLSRYSPYSRASALLLEGLFNQAGGTQTDPNAAPAQ